MNNEKLIFFIIYLERHKIMFNHAEGINERENFGNFQFYVVKLSFFDVKTYEKLAFFIIFWD